MIYRGKESVKIDLPCHHCLLYPACLNHLVLPTSYTDVMMSIYKRCTLLKEYLKSIHEYSTYPYDPCKVEFIVDYFNMRNGHYDCEYREHPL